VIGDRLGHSTPPPFNASTEVEPARQATHTIPIVFAFHAAFDGFGTSRRFVVTRKFGRYIADLSERLVQTNSVENDLATLAPQICCDAQRGISIKAPDRGAAELAAKKKPWAINRANTYRGAALPKAANTGGATLGGAQPRAYPHGS
jgi:hypothetical protein